MGGEETLEREGGEEFEREREICIMLGIFIAGIWRLYILINISCSRQYPIY